MEGKYSNFKSHSSIKFEEGERQKARELILKQAKRKYEAEEAKIEKAKKAGEGTWMLDSLSKRLDNEKKVLDKAKKKEKKKRKKEKRKTGSSKSSSSDDDDEPQWVEKGAMEETKPSSVPLKGPQLQRESWMEAPLDFLPLTSRQEIRAKVNQEKAEAKKEANKMLEPGQHVRELNPYWKNGGTGLPPERKDAVSESICPSKDQPGKHTGRSRDRSRMFAKPMSDDEDDDFSDRRSFGQTSRSIGHRRDNNDSYEDRRDRGKAYHVSSRKSPEKLNNESPRWKKTSHEEHRKSASGRGPRERRRSRSSSSSPDRTRVKSRGKQFSKPGSSSDDSSKGKMRRRRRSPDRGDRTVPRWKKSSQREDKQEENSPRRTERDRERRKSRSRSSSSDADDRRRSSHSAPTRKFARPDEDSDNEPVPRRRRSPQRGSTADVPRWKKKAPSPPRRDTEARDKEEHRSRERRRSRSPSSSSPSGSSSESESDTAQKEEVVAQILSEEELNALAAKILRAEIMGDDDLAAELKSKLESARKQREAAKSGTNAAPDFTAKRGQNRPQRAEKRKGRGEEAEEGEDNVVVLSRTNKAGMVRPVLGEATETWGGAAGKKKRKNVSTHDTTGMRTVYFDNDDKFDLKTLVEQEKAGTAEDQNSMFARLAGRSVNKDLDVDDMFVSRAAKKQDDEKAFNKDRAAAVFEHRKQTAAMEKCHRCLKHIPKHLIIALGTKSYLCLPAHRSLTEGHCLIVPMAHCASATSMDEDVWQEMQHFRKSLVQMFREQDQDVVIIETVMHLKHFPHTALECVPLDIEVGDMAPIYFKKAIQEAGPEWSDNKKLHDLKGKDVRRVIPKGFPYFAVDFGADSGFATVIEDERTFPAYFGREIVGGMIDAEPSLWRKPHKQSFEDQRQKVLQFEKWWKPFDWTQDVSNTT